MKSGVKVKIDLLQQSNDVHEFTVEAPRLNFQARLHRNTHTPCLALSSLYFAATSLNFSPAFSRSSASKHFDCFSHKMCLTCSTASHSCWHRAV